MALTLNQQIQLLQAAGIPVTTSKPKSGSWVEWAPGIYTVNQSGNLNDPYHGLTAQQYQLAASITDPYLNPQALNQQLQQAGVPAAAPVGTPPASTVAAGQPAPAGGVLPIVPPAALGGFTPFTPTGQTPGGAGVADPYQPFGAGFGTDYGLDPTQDPNFAFGSGSTAPPAAQPGAAEQPTIAASAVVAAPSAPPFGPGTLVYGTDPTGTVNRLYTQTPAGSAGFGALQPVPQGVTVPAGVTRPTTLATAGQAQTAGGTAAQQTALGTLKQTLDTYGLGSLANWAWGEIVAGKSEQQVLLDLMQRPEFKGRFPGIQARADAGLPAISPGDYVNYENQATQMMRAAGLPSGFWDSPADFTHLISSDVSLNELSKRLDLGTQAAYQVPADVRAALARDYGVGAGQLAAFFLDDKTAEPLLARDFTAAQIGGAAYRTGYGSTKSEDERLTDLGVTAGQAQQGFNQLTLQRQLFSSLPGENTTGISRENQLGATFAGDTQSQEQIVKRSQARQAAFAGGGGFSQGGIGQAQGA